MPSARLKKVNDLIRDEIGKIIRTELDFEGLLVTVVRAGVSPTLENATIYVSVFPDKQAKRVLKELSKNVYDLQQVLNKKVVLRPVPKIRFELDSTEEEAQRIENLIDSAINKDTAQW